ncbi:protein shisa-5-like [Arapaima gigas]
MIAAAPPALLFAICGALVSAAAADYCKSYTNPSGTYHPDDLCGGSKFCCGTCFSRYCCSLKYLELDDDAQDKCSTYESIKSPNTAAIASGILSVVIFIVVVISCCVCPCCCIYKMCRKSPRPVVTTHTTTVINAPYPQQPAAPQAYQGAAYQPVSVPVQPAYGVQPMPTAPYQGQPYPSQGYMGQNPGPPPPYQETGPAYPPAPMPYSQAGYRAGQPTYPPQPPAMPPFEATQPAYNPAYVEPPKTGY